MANTKKPEGAKTAAASEPEVTYTVDEFAMAAVTVFGAGTTPDLVRAALGKNGLKIATVSQARKLVEAFAKKEVK